MYTLEYVSNNVYTNEEIINFLKFFILKYQLQNIEVSNYKIFSIINKLEEEEVISIEIKNFLLLLINKYKLHDTLIINWACCKIQFL